MTWREILDSYLSARRNEKPESTEQLVKEARRRLGQVTVDDWQFLENSLSDPEGKWFVAEVFAAAPVPRRLLKALLRAAVYEVNPSFNRYFVEPCIASFGHRVVNEALLAYVEAGSDFEKAGAVNALYWAGVPLYFRGDVREYTLENATPESRAAYLELKDVWLRKRCLFLREFVSNKDVHVRRSIIPSLNLEEGDYPDPLLTGPVAISGNRAASPSCSSSSMASSGACRAFRRASTAPPEFPPAWSCPTTTPSNIPTCWRAFRKATCGTNFGPAIRSWLGGSPSPPNA